MKIISNHLLVAALVVALGASANAGDTRTFSVQSSLVDDEKSVFATVESANVVLARVRTGGTIADLKVKQGDRVTEGQIIAVVGDQKLGLQIQAQGAQVSAMQAQVDVARRELQRGEELLKEGFATKSKLDQLRASYDVALNNLKSLTAQQSVTQQQQTEGKVLAPTAGRVLTVPVTAGSVVMSGDVIATLAEQNYILRLSVPERHAQYIRVGDRVRVDVGDNGAGDYTTDYGTIKLIYPKVEGGRVQADAVVKGLGDYFVGQRIKVWIGAGKRRAIIIPTECIATRSGIDYVSLKNSVGSFDDVPIQRGRNVSTTDMPYGVEVLSGLKNGDSVVQP